MCQISRSRSKAPSPNSCEFNGATAMWIYLILITLGRVHPFLADSDPDAKAKDLTPDITTTEPNDSTVEPNSSTYEPSLDEPTHSTEELSLSTIEPNKSTFEPSPDEPTHSTDELTLSTIETNKSNYEPSPVEPTHSTTNAKDLSTKKIDSTVELQLSTESSDSKQEVIPSGVENENYPYMVAILHTNNYLLGAGAIIGKKWIVVTAFQLGAFKPQQLQVRVGSEKALSGGTLFKVQQLFPHPMFSQFNNDVALLKTAEDIMFSPSVQTIPVANVPPEMGAQAALMVWSDDLQIHKNKADILPVSECKDFFPYFELTESNICVVMDHVLPYRVMFYGSPLVFNHSLIGLYMGLEANTFKPSLCSSLSPLTGWLQMMMTNETDTQRLFPIA